MRVLAVNDLADAILPLTRTRQRLAAADEEAIAEVNAIVAELREEHRRRPRLEQEFDRVGLP